MKKKLCSLFVFSIMIFSIITQTKSLSGWAFLNNQKECQLNCQNGGVCAYNTDDVTEHKCICFIGMHYGKECELLVEAESYVENVTKNLNNVLESEKQNIVKENFNEILNYKTPLYEETKEPNDDALYESELLINNDKNNNNIKSDELNSKKSSLDSNKKQNQEFNKNFNLIQKTTKELNKNIDNFFYTTEIPKNQQDSLIVNSTLDLKRIIDNNHHNILKINNDESPIFKTTNLKKYEHDGITQQIKSNRYSSETTLSSTKKNMLENYTRPIRPYRFKSSTTTELIILNDENKESDEIYDDGWMMTAKRRSSVNKITYNYFVEIIVFLMVLNIF